MYYAILLPIVNIIFWYLFVPRYCVCVAETSHRIICIRQEDDVKIKFNSTKCINTHASSHHEDIHFMDLLENSTVFVDKTLLIKEILETIEKVILITSPPGTGKSINLSMLKAFFEIRVKKAPPSSHQTQLAVRTETSTYKFFTSGELDTSTDSPLQSMSRISNATELSESNRVATYEHPPLISKRQPIIDEHLSQYPVIYLDFDSTPFNLSNITHSLRIHVCDAFVKHRFLGDLLNKFIEKIPNAERKEKVGELLENFTFYRNCCIDGTPIDAVDLENGVLKLSETLHELFEKPVIILVDNYIANLQYYLFETNVTYADGIQVLRNFMKKTFSDNRFFEKAILTGTLSVNKKDLFADVSDFMHYNAIDNALQLFYGFTKCETNVLVNHFGMPAKFSTNAKRFYKSYSMKPNVNLTIYNSWSIANFLNEKRIDKYWVNRPDTIDNLERWFNVPKLKFFLKPLVEYNHMLIEFKDLDFDIKPLTHQRTTIYNEDETNRILSLFCEMGLLTVADPRNLDDDNTTHAYVRVPNDEIRRALKKSAALL